MKLAPRVVVAAMALTLAIPAVADAKSSTSVGVHVARAHHALMRVKRNTLKNHNAVAARALRTARHETALASSAARHTKGSAVARANAFGNVAVQYDEDFSTFTSLLGHSSGSMPSLLAQALQPSLSGRQMAISSLQGLLGSLPASMLPDVTALITQLIGGTPGQAGLLAGLLGGGLPASLQQLVEQTLATATGIATAGIAQVEQLLTMLPAGDQAAIKAALDQIVLDLQHLSTVLGGILGGTPTTPTTPTTPACPTTGAPGGLGGLIGAPLAIIGQLQGFLQQILGLVLGGSSTPPAPACGSTPTAGGFLPFPGFLQSLLGRLGLGGLGLGGIGLGGLL